MALSVSSCPRVAASRRSAPRRAQTVVVKAVSLQEASNWIGQAFVRIFSPDDTKVTAYPTHEFTGQIDHSKRRPFKDGFSSNAQLPPSSSLESIEAPDAVGYMGDAVKGVVAGFPKVGESAEPEWTGATTAWRGDVHKSVNKRDEREGFHVKKF